MKIKEAAQSARDALAFIAAGNNDAACVGYAWGTLAEIAAADGKPVPAAPWRAAVKRRLEERSKGQS